VPSIVPKPGQVEDLVLKDNSPGLSDSASWHRQVARDARNRWRWIAAGGVVAAVPVAPGFTWLITGRHGAGTLLAVSAVIVVVTLALNTVTAMYQARQETRRREIDRRGADLLAAAMARCIDDARARATGLSEAEAVKEAARVRASANQALADMSSALRELLGQSSSQGQLPSGLAPGPGVAQATGPLVTRPGKIL